MEISKSVKISGTDSRDLKEMANSLRTIIDAMNTGDSIETENHFWEYDQLVEAANLLSDFAENDVVFIR